MDIYALSENDRYKLLEQLALKLIRGKELTIDESEFIGRGLMAMTCGNNLNDAFRVKKKKNKDFQQDALRLTLYDRLKSGKLVGKNIIDKLKEVCKDDPKSKVVFSQEEEVTMGFENGKPIKLIVASAKNVNSEQAYLAVGMADHEMKKEGVLDINKDVSEAIKTSCKNARKVRAEKLEK